MKKPKLIRLRLFLGLTPGRSRRRGVAIITVLAIISLMTVLIISFFTMAQSQKTTAINSVEMQRVVTLKDTAINLVMAQIREATTLLGDPANPTIWTSQPGAVRTYSTSPLYTRFYKLYSAEKMMIDNIKDGESKILLQDLKKDVDPKWDDFPDMYVDMNRPMRPAGFGDEEESAAKVRTRLIFPIVDPSRYNGQESAKTENTEGFVYGESRLDAAKVNGVDPNKGQLAMPVRWIYLLEDGTPGVIGKDGKFAAIGKASAGTPSKENPIVSRVAWWTDDESCKINVNTASLPIPWDTPRTSSSEDLWYAQHQPVNGECQHYPSHPAQTDLTAVLYPGYRYSPDTSALPVGAEMNPLPPKYASLIWNISPFITETGGTEGGTKRVNLSAEKPVLLDENDHLFATFEELYFKARKEDRNLNRARETVAKDDTGSKMLDRLAGSQFFLTTRSNGPEMTIWGTPRLCMFPMHSTVVTEVGKTGGTLPPRVGAFEVTMATNCTIATKPYYFLRADNPGSRHNNFFADHGGRNTDLETYLRNLTEARPPGYPELPKALDTFKKKYPGPNGANLGQASDNPGKPDFDSTDRCQILLSMLDYIRSTNMTPGYIQGGNAYDNGNGQVSGICGCNAKNDSNPQPKHTTALIWNTKVVTPKGSGRTYGPAELIMFAHVVTVKKGDTVTGVPVNSAGNEMGPDAMNKWNDQEFPDKSLIQVGMLVNAFSPRQGWAPLFASAGMNISGQVASGDPNDPRSAPGANAPIIVSGTAGVEYQMKIGTAVAWNGFNTADPTPPNGVPPGVVAWAGLVGPRMLNHGTTAKVALLDPIVYTGTGAGGTDSINMDLKWMPGQLLRVFFYDSQDPNPVNITQGVDLDMGQGIIRMRVEYTGKTMTSMMRNATEFPPPKVAIRSFVVPHGDYRLTTIPLRVERGMFVPHGGDKHSVVEPILSGRNVTYVPSPGYQLAEGPEGLFGDPKIPQMNIGYAPHLAPVKGEFLCNEALGTKPPDKVVAVASSGGPIRAARFATGRRDGQYSGPKYQPYTSANQIPNRGSSDPLETSDFDNGVGLCPDGPYMNQPDDGDSRDSTYPYYGTLLVKSQTNPASFSPNRLVRSAVDFGSIPNGVQARVPWQTLRFRPDPSMYKGQCIYQDSGSQPQKPDGYNHYFPFSNYCGPKDHLLLDMFWVPVVEPWSISEAFATKGLINLNQQIFPFTYIERTTALHALMRSERMMAIPDERSNDYKNGTKFPDRNIYRHWINAKETLKQLTDFRWRGEDAEGFSIPFNAFRSASEICELWLVPEKNSAPGEINGAYDLQFTIREFWKQNRLTGDNMRERPYANIYPRLTVRSNVYKIHIVSQTLKKAASNSPDSFTTEYKDGVDPDMVTAEWRGSALIERVINPNDPGLRVANLDYALNFKPGTNTVPKLDNFYNYRVTEVKQVTE